MLSNFENASKKLTFNATQPALALIVVTRIPNEDTWAIFPILSLWELSYLKSYLVKNSKIQTMKRLLFLTRAPTMNWTSGILKDALSP